MGSKEKILIAEDDLMIAEIYQRVFRDANFDITVVGSGRDVVAAMEKECHAIVLLDIMLPDMNGLDALAHIKKIAQCDAKIFMFSNIGDRDSRNRALALGADGFIEKSKFAPKEIVEQVQRFLGYHEETQKNVERSTHAQTHDTAQEQEAVMRKILLIEDQKIFTDMFGQKLTDNGYDVTISHNGAWGMKEALQQDFDLIIMDMVMPAMTGDKMLAQLRADKKTKDVPVIILSASATDEEIARVCALGIEEYFLKTHITPTELAQSVAMILQKEV